MSADGRERGIIFSDVINVFYANECLEYSVKVENLCHRHLHGVLRDGKRRTLERGLHYHLQPSVPTGKHKEGPIFEGNSISILESVPELNFNCITIIDNASRLSPRQLEPASLGCPLCLLCFY